jgi:hypothetical protein
MASLSTHLDGIMAVDGSTIFLLLMLCGSVIWVIRDKVASVFTLLLVFPVAMVGSIVAYYGFVSLELFNVKKMGEWLIWTIMAGTVGTFLAISVAVVVGSAIERSGKAAAP